MGRGKKLRYSDNRYGGKMRDLTGELREKMREFRRKI
jgi:hypothetical protein